MINPDERERKSIAMIASSPEGRDFVKFLERGLAEQDENNRLKEDIQMYRGQGASILLDELIKLVKP